MPSEPALECGCQEDGYRFMCGYERWTNGSCSSPWILNTAIRAWESSSIHADKGGKFAKCQLLDWIGAQIPSKKEIDRLPVRYELGTTEITSSTTTCFMFVEPKTKKDKDRVLRTDIMSEAVMHDRGSMACLVWPYVDRLLKEIFGIE